MTTTKSFFACRLFWLRGGAIVLAIMLTTFLVSLPFGNCQWTKYHYIFQAYIWPGFKGGIIKPSKEYSGTWIQWHHNGQKHYEGYLQNGVVYSQTYFYKNGIKRAYFTLGWDTGYSTQREWFNNGQIWYIKNWKNGKPYGIWTWRYKNGKSANRIPFRYGKIHGVWRQWNEQGSIIYLKYYLNGTQITRQQYLAACAKDPTLPKPYQSHQKRTDCTGPGTSARSKRHGNSGDSIPNSPTIPNNNTQSPPLHQKQKIPPATPKSSR